MPQPETGCGTGGIAIASHLHWQGLPARAAGPFGAAILGQLPIARPGRGHRERDVTVELAEQHVELGVFDLPLRMLAERPQFTYHDVRRVGPDLRLTLRPVETQS